MIRSGTHWFPLDGCLRHLKKKKKTQEALITLYLNFLSLLLGACLELSLSCSPLPLPLSYLQFSWMAEPLTLFESSIWSETNTFWGSNWSFFFFSLQFLTYNVFIVLQDSQRMLFFCFCLVTIDWITWKNQPQFYHHSYGCFTQTTLLLSVFLVFLVG